jgi:hypothetical protein
MQPSRFSRTLIVSLILTLPLGTLLPHSTPALGADPEAVPSTATVAETRLILEKGIRASGGAEKLTRYRGLVLKGEGKVSVGNETIPFTGTWHTQGLDKSRTLIAVRLNKGAPAFESCTVVNGSTGWRKEDGGTKELEGEWLFEEKEHLYLNWVTMLVPLREQQYKLTLLPEGKLNNKPVVGIGVSAQGHRDIKLFFDRDSGLLVKTERKVRDVDNKQDIVEAILYSDYKEVNGVQVAMRYRAAWDGTDYADVQMTEARVYEKLDDKWFQKP